MKFIFSAGCTFIVITALLVPSTLAQEFSDLFLFSTTARGPLYVTLVQGRDAALYGTTIAGGGSLGLNNGTIFRTNTTGTGQVLYSLAGGTDGYSPEGGVALGTDGNLYGTATFSATFGVLFKVTPSGVYTVLHTFEGGTDGAYPKAPPVEASDGNLYGTTTGNPGGFSTVYRYSRNGTFTSIYQIGPPQFTVSPLIQANDGALYGTTYDGCGSIFKLTTSGTLLATYNFPCGAGGANPLGPLLQGSDGNFYGVTEFGGTAPSPQGTVYKMTQHGAVSILHSFDKSGPQTPEMGLVEGTDGLLYGSTGGPAFDCLFQITKDGVFTNLYNFVFATGGNPFGSMVQHTDGAFYGTTYAGGFGHGVLFKLDMGLGPFVTFVRPTGKVGQTMQILGRGLTGASSVTLNGVASTSVSVVSDTYMTAVVPMGATTGMVVVTTPTGTLTSNKSFRISQ